MAIRRGVDIDWMFAPTPAVVQDYRCDLHLRELFVRPGTRTRLGAAFGAGLQGDFACDTNVVATVKRFIATRR